MDWCICSTLPGVLAQEAILAQGDVVLARGEAGPGLTLRQLLDAGGTIGFLILALSILMVAVAVQHLLMVRRRSLMPAGLADSVHGHIATGQIVEAETACREQPSVLSRLLGAGLAEIRLSYAAVEKAMEDAAVEQSARLFRQVEYLSTIGTIAPMLGLLGTVWGMILAFLEFEQKANPQVSELAPGIYRALVTTLLGLMVAVPALSLYALFRNRVEERMAETALLAEQVFADYKRSRPRKKATPETGTEGRGRPLPAAARQSPEPPRGARP